jgi:hypothetical protein
MFAGFFVSIVFAVRIQVYSSLFINYRIFVVTLTPCPYSSLQPLYSATKEYNHGIYLYILHTCVISSNFNNILRERSEVQH